MSNDTAVMVDIETLATTPDAVVVAIGAVRFNLRQMQKSAELRMNGFYRRLGVPSQKGRRIDPDTMKWWLHQPIIAREQCMLALDEKQHYTAGLDAFLEWMRCAPHTIWANSPSFDLVILRDLAGGADVYYDPRFAPSHRMGMLWGHRQERDLRTLWAMFPNVEEPYAPKHHALEDAARQANIVQTIYTQNPGLGV